MSRIYLPCKFKFYYWQTSLELGEIGEKSFRPFLFFLLSFFLLSFFLSLRLAIVGVYRARTFDSSEPRVKLSAGYNDRAAIN